MKKILTLSILYNLQVCCMQPVQENKIGNIVHAISQILQTRIHNTPEQTITMIQEQLKMFLPTTEESSLAQKSLVEEFSQQVMETFQCTSPGEDNTTIIITRTIFFDGTESIKQDENFYPLDRSEQKTLYPKPSSPWHVLAFEDFIRAYCHAQYSYTEKQKTKA